MSKSQSRKEYQCVCDFQVQEISIKERERGDFKWGIRVLRLCERAREKKGENDAKERGKSSRIKFIT